MILSSSCGLRGGSCSYCDVYYLGSPGRGYLSPIYEELDIGFRGASIPEPATLLLLALGGLALPKRRRTLVVMRTSQSWRNSLPSLSPRKRSGDTIKYMLGHFFILYLKWSSVFRHPSAPVERLLQLRRNPGTMVSASSSKGARK
ncbi:MAG: PEP-CTERM sorting domain-containing protein [Sedimentisphaerales bacterium]|nr:PEP-CTERM sorting domain-containing protein [Sedimentisphaerales bacterium]